MKKLIEKRFFDRNTQKGVERYLSVLGFDLELGYTLQRGPNDKLVYAVQNEAKKKAKKLFKKAPRSK